MPVTVVCDKCGRQLRIADEQVGKRAKCPQCKEVILLQPAGEKMAAAKGGGSATTTAARTTAAGGSGKGSKTKADWFVLTADQQEFGPISRVELDQWVSEGRIDSQCQVLQEGWEQWKWADEVFPALAAQTPAGDASVGSGSLPSFTPSAAPGGIPSFSPSPAPGATVPAGGTAPFQVAANPYASPGVVSTPGTAGGAPPDLNGAVPQNILTPLRNTSTWVLVFVILGGLGLLMSGLGMLAFMGLSLAGGSVGGMLSGLIMFAPGLAVTGLFTYLLYNYWNAIGNCSRQPTFLNLQKAIEAQQVYWMAVAIGVLIMIGLQLLAMLIMMLVGGVLLGGLMRGMP